MSKHRPQDKKKPKPKKLGAGAPNIRDTV